MTCNCNLNGGMALTAEQVEDVRTVAGDDEELAMSGEFWAARDRLRVLFPATEPAEDAAYFDVDTGPVKRVKFKPAPVEPAEEETKAEEVCTGSGGHHLYPCVLPDGHAGVHVDRRGLRWNSPASSPVVPAPTETEWQRIEDVPVGVLQIKDRHGRTWLMVGGTWRFEWHDGNWYEPHTNINAQAPFVAAEEE